MSALFLDLLECAYEYLSFAFAVKAVNTGDASDFSAAVHATPRAPVPETPGGNGGNRGNGGSGTNGNADVSDWAKNGAVITTDGERATIQNGNQRDYGSVNKRVSYDVDQFPKRAG
ncbi:hypothetical protein J7E85_19520 [Paenibacillus sp. ISL-20]|nr:hypothetical protein [Paenibacillus sp. ISL-20]